MQITPINNQHKQSFGLKFKLSEKTVAALEESTGLNY